MKPIILATCPALANLFHDDVPLVAAFAQRGYEARPMPWQDIEPSAVPVVIRTPWDYTEHREEFAAWLDDLEQAGTPVVNPVALMRWNLDKKYLTELADRGHRIVPTQVIGSFDATEVQAIMKTHDWSAAVAKPVIGAGATGLVVVDAKGTRTFDAAGNAWIPAASGLPQGEVLVQPLLQEIDEGEWSLFYFAGQYSHAILKRPAKGDIRVQEEHGGVTVAATPTNETRRAADALVADVPEAVYARVDGVVIEGRFHLMELELIEPELYIRYADGAAADRFVDAVVATLG